MREPTPIVICPLEFERASLARHGLDRVAQLVCTGPGPEAIRGWCASADPRRGPVILAGLAGSLDPALAPGRAGLVTGVVDTDGTRFEPSLPAAGAPALGVVAAAEAIVTTDAGRVTLADRTGAALVDLESGAFARWAERHRWTWGIARGISDGPGAPLPPAIAAWTDGRGRTRSSRVLRDLAADPRLLADVFRIRRASRAALAAVAGVVEMVLRG